MADDKMSETELEQDRHHEPYASDKQKVKLSEFRFGETEE
jgi:hypothetical protein